MFLGLFLMFLVLAAIALPPLLAFLGTVLFAFDGLLIIVASGYYGHNYFSKLVSSGYAVYFWDLVIIATAVFLYYKLFQLIYYKLPIVGKILSAIISMFGVSMLCLEFTTNAALKYRDFVYGFSLRLFDNVIATSVVDYIVYILLVIFVWHVRDQKLSKMKIKKERETEEDKEVEAKIKQLMEEAESNEQARTQQYQTVKVEKPTYITFNKTNSMLHSIKCKLCSGHYVSKQGKSGAFFGCSNFPECKSTIDYNGFVSLVFAKEGISVYRWNRECWKCNRMIPVYSYYLNYTLNAYSDSTQAVFSNNNYGLGYNKPLDEMIAKDIPTLKMSHSKTEDVDYIANRCEFCDAMQGRYFIVDEPEEIEDDLEERLMDKYFYKKYDFRKDLMPALESTK